MSQSHSYLSENPSITTRSQIRKSELKIASGIKALYESHIMNQQLAADIQNITTIRLSAAECGPFSDFFPNKLANGVTIHLYKSNFVKHPPIKFIIEEKIKALCEAAQKMSPAIVFNPNALLIEANNKLELLVNQLRYKKIPTATFAAELSQHAEELIKEMTVKLLHQLYEHSNKSKYQNEFNLDLYKLAQSSRTSESATLTFNEETFEFSFDEGSKIAAHHRKIGDGVANLSIVCEGSYAVNQNEVAITPNIAYVKHTSPVALDDFKSASEVELIIDAYNNLKEIIAEQAKLIVHGSVMQQPNLEINWVYLLLTTSILDIEKQGTAYKYIYQAFLLLDGANFNVNGVTVTVNAKLFNAGINQATKLENATNTFFKGSSAKNIDSLQAVHISNIKRRENRKAFLNLTAALNNIPLVDAKSDSELTELADITHKLKSLLTLKDEDYLTNNQNIHPNNFNSNNPIEVKEILKTKIDANENPADSVRTQTASLEKNLRDEWNKNRDTVANRVYELKQYCRQHPEIITNLDTEIQLSIAALIFKSYINELYLSNAKYQEAYADPMKAALMNAYLINYLHCIGFTTSVGCKSANDRTFVIRLLTAAVASNSQTNDIDAFNLDANRYPRDLDNYLNANCMSNSALITTIKDTSAPPKVDSNKFEILKLTNGIKSLNHLGKLALHKEAKKYKLNMSANVTGLIDNIRNFFRRN